MAWDFRRRLPPACNTAIVAEPIPHRHRSFRAFRGLVTMMMVPECLRFKVGKVLETATQPARPAQRALWLDFRDIHLAGYAGVW